MHKKEILATAIADIQGNIRAIDNKITFLLGVVGIIFASLVGVKDNVLCVYRNSKINILLLQMAIIIGLFATVAIFVSAIMCMFPKMSLEIN